MRFVAIRDQTDALSPVSYEGMCRMRDGEMLTDEVIAKVREELTAADARSAESSGRSVEAWLMAILAVEPVFLNTVDVDDPSSTDHETLSERYRSLAEAGANVSHRVRSLSDRVMFVGVGALLVTLAGVSWAFWNEGNLGRLLVVGFLAVFLVYDAVTRLRHLRSNWPVDRKEREKLVAQVVFIDGMVLFFALLLLSSVPSVVLEWGGQVVEVSGEWVLLAVVGASVAFIALFFVLVLVLYLVGRLLAGIANRSCPEAIAFFAAALVFSQLIPRTPGNHELPGVRTIELAARSLARVGRTRRLRGRAAQAVFEDRFAQAAAATRATALRVALPTAGTHASLCTFYANLMRTILSGSYGDLPAAPPRAEVTRRARTRVVLSVLRTVVVGASPGVLLWLGQSFWGPIPTAGHTLTIVVSAWGVLVLLGLVDPHLRERVDIAKNVAGLFSGKP